MDGDLKVSVEYLLAAALAGTLRMCKGMEGHGVQRMVINDIVEA